MRTLASLPGLSFATDLLTLVLRRHQEAAAEGAGVQHTVLAQQEEPAERSRAQPSRSGELLKTASSGLSTAKTASSGLESRSHISSASELSQRPLQVLSTGLVTAHAVLATYSCVGPAGSIAALQQQGRGVLTCADLSAWLSFG